MRIFLSGPMGSGKSTIGAIVAKKAGLPARDLDALIERRIGSTVAQFFEREGEAAFRALESQVLAEQLQGDDGFVLSLGGGTVIDRASRHRLLRAGTLVTLDAPLAALARRVGGGAGRPLLAGQSVEARLQALIAERQGAYAECHGKVDTGALSPSAAAEAVMELARTPAIAVPLGERTYLAESGAGVRRRVVQRVGAATSVVLVTDETVAPLFGHAIADAIEAAGTRVIRVVLPPGEQAKHVGSMQTIWETALSAGIDRRALVVGVGGGVVGDLAGFAAATLLRGIDVGHIPTTLLSMVDSSIGGKTGFDTPQGKNLVGAFHQPRFVLADVETLGTLPRQERIAGLAEVVKSAWIDSEAAVAQLEADADALREGEPEATARAIHMSCGLKAYVVTEDEREGGLRAVLNLGHTVGHAIEAFQGYSGIRHGEAVALGMVAACRLACAVGAQRPEEAQRLERLLDRLGLPTALDAHLVDGVSAFLSKDKKMDGAQLKFVVPGAPGDVRIEPMPLQQIIAHVFGQTH